MWDNRRPRNRSSHGSSITRPRYSVRLPILDPSPYRSLEHLACTAGRYPVPHITPTTWPGHDDLYRDQHCLVGCSASRGCTCRKCAHVSLHRPRSSPPTLPSLPPLTRPVSSSRLSAGEHVRPSARGVWLASPAFLIKMSKYCRVGGLHGLPGKSCLRKSFRHLCGFLLPCGYRVLV